MDPENSLQDLVRCHLCENPDPPLHCVICEKYLCEGCVETHISDECKKHKVLPLKFQGCIFKCQKHPSKIYNRFCEQCNIPLCVECASSMDHNDHGLVSVVDKFIRLKIVLRKDLIELKKTIYPKYWEILSAIPVQKADFNEKLQKLVTAIDKHGKYMLREIDNAMNKLKSDLDEIATRHLAVLNSVSELTQIINDLKKLLSTNNINKFSAYKSRNAEFRTPPPEPSFTPSKIDQEEFYQEFGFLSASYVKSEKYSNTVDSFTDESSSLVKPLNDKPQIIASLNTEYRSLNSVSCVSDEQIWTCGFNDIVMRLYNLHGEVVKSIQTKTLKGPKHMIVTGNGDLVYTDEDARTVNIVRNTQVKTVIRLRWWRPLYICSTLSGDLLVVMNKDDERKTKIVRYSGFEQKQSIQYNSKGHPLYVYGVSPKFICENRNLDICLADLRAGAIVVVSQAGHLRFIYTGPSSKTKKTFSPVGITTDSQSRILTSDCYNNSIHILNYDGQFLCYIDNCYLHDPRGLCVDSRDNLFVAERSGRVKKIKYCI